MSGLLLQGDEFRVLASELERSSHPFDSLERQDHNLPPITYAKGKFIHAGICMHIYKQNVAHV